MTIDSLIKSCTAIRAAEIKFDYFKRELIMIVFPEYGYDANLDGHKITLTFKECIYFCCCNTSKMAENEDTEFVYWGIQEAQNSLLALNSYLRKTISSGFAQYGGYRRTDFLPSDSLPAYRHYYFQNALGDALDVVSSDVSVSLDKPEE